MILLRDVYWNLSRKTHRKSAAILMLYPTEMLDLLPPVEQIDAHLKHQKSIFRPRADEFLKEKSRKKSPRIGLFKPFLGLLSLAGAEGLEPSARGFGVALGVC